jgi:hypothetical protein
VVVAVKAVKKDRQQLEQAGHQLAPKELAGVPAEVAVLLMILAVVAVVLVVTPEMEVRADRQVLVQKVPVAVAVAVSQPTQVKDTAVVESESSARVLVASVAH